MPIYVGTKVRVWCQSLVNAELTNAEEVTFTWRNPEGVTTVATLAAGEVKLDSTGRYYGEVSLSLPGTYSYQFATSNPTGVDKGSFFVERALE